MEYNVDYFIGKFSATVESSWNEGFQNKNDGTHCALGHCDDFSMQNTLGDVLKPIQITITKSMYGNDYGKVVLGALKVAAINNGETAEYQQPTPKQRILAALQDVKKLQEAEKNPKERIVYVTVDESVRKLQKELELN